MAIQAMIEREMPQDFVVWYSFYLRNRTITATLLGVTKTRQLTRGTPQGGVLSPLLWNLVFESALVDMSDGAFIIGFADDGCIIVVGPCPETCRNLVQIAINKALNWGQKNGLEFNAEKTVAIHFKRGPTANKHPTNLTVGGAVIEWSKEVTYLGLVINSSLSWTAHIKAKAKSAKRLLFAARNYVGRHYGPRPDMLKYVWQTCIVPIMLYASHVWAHSCNDTQRLILRQVNRLAMLTFAHVHRGTPTQGLEVIYDVTPLHLKAKELALAAHDRILRHVKPSWNGIGNSLQRGHLWRIRQHKDAICDNIPTDVALASNWGTRAWISGKPATDEEMGRTQIFTDGSRMDDRTGGGYSIQQNGVEIHADSFRMPDYATVYQAELAAIELALHKTKNMGIRGKVSLHTDSLSSVQALQAQDITSAQCLETLQAVRDLAAKADLRIHWIKAHVGHPGNERADELAKAGLTSSTWKSVGISMQRRKQIYRADTRANWAREWNGWSMDPARQYKQTKVWFPELDAKKSRQMLKQGRSKLSSQAQWITGFCNTMSHRYVKTRNHPNPLYRESPTCRLCREEDETPDHLAFYCPATFQERLQNFRVHLGQPEAWTPQTLHRFMMDISHHELLVDETEYH